MPGRSLAGQRGARACPGRVLLAEQALAEVAERVGAQPGDVHLGDAELLADLRLGHVVVKAAFSDSARRPRSRIFAALPSKSPTVTSICATATRRGDRFTIPPPPVGRCGGEAVPTGRRREWAPRDRGG